jgi:hypothetical protein
MLASIGFKDLARCIEDYYVVVLACSFLPASTPNSSSPQQKCIKEGIPN